MAKFSNIDEYIATFPDDIQILLQQMREAIQSVAPSAVEKISYQMPTFAQHGNLVHFAAWKKHIGFYPVSSGVEAFADDLSAYDFSKGSIRFPLDQPLPLDLIQRIVEFRVVENIEKAEQKKRKRK